MAVPTQGSITESSKTQGVAVVLTGMIILLGIVSSLGGLFIPGLYRDTPYLVAQAKGQDLVTLLIAVPALAVTLFYVRRGSARANLAWIGLLGYMLYTYTTYAFGSAFNEFFLIYVALFSLSIFTLVAAVGGIDPAAWQKRFDAATPRRAVAAFLILSGFVLSALWLPDIIRFLMTGKLPASLVLAGIPTNFVYVMDLGLVVPLAFLSGISLWRRLPWGFILAGVMLTKLATMGLALLSMVWLMSRGGQPLEIGPAVFAAVVTVGSLGLGAWFFRHCHG
ncbi:MAG: hypothetical protein JWN15_2834 [Firmicutes bacterium]|nr:hypothetical protein [Bacillota bacterium]